MEFLEVEINQGVVVGCYEPLPNGGKFSRFSGIPFAHTPVNELRFRAPKKLEKFPIGKIDCTKDRDPCYHKSVFIREMIGSEDCLYLNVFVPENPTKKKLPVMVFIHGGGFSLDSSTIDIYSPEYLLMEDVVVVTFNYRLHVLGFLCLPSVGIYGNAGLKDQQMAIEWVYENIENFGGNAENICLFGESAGGASVHLQVLNEKSRKMIKSAICQSGCALGDWVMQKDGVGVTRRLARILGCEIDEDLEMYKTIMAASSEELFNLAFKPQDPDETRRNLVFTFKPVVEIDSREAFMTSPPTELIKLQKNKINIPIMFGINDKDGIAMTVNFRKKFNTFNNDYVRLLPMSLKINPNSEEGRNLSRKFKGFYFQDRLITEASIDNFIDYSTDYYFLIPQIISNELHLEYNQGSKQFLYEFRFDGELNNYKTLIRMNHIQGAAHGDELGYLFRQRLLNWKFNENSREGKMIKVLCKLWTNFAKYHDPTPLVENPINIKWKPIIAKGEFSYLIIDDELKIEKNIHSKRINFWREIYEKINKKFIVAKL